MLAIAPPDRRAALTMVERSRSAFGAELHAIREGKRQRAMVSEASRFTVRGLAERAGLSPSAISQLETGIDPRTGKDVRPRPDTVDMLANALSDNEKEAEEIHDRLMRAAGYVPRTQHRATSSGVAEESSIEVIVRHIRGAPELSDEDKEALAHLVERSRRIVRGEPDPG